MSTIYNLYPVTTRHRTCAMLRVSHTLQSAQQYSHPSHFTDKRTEAPTVEFVQPPGSTGFKSIGDGAQGTFSERSFSLLVVLTHVCEILLAMIEDVFHLYNWGARMLLASGEKRPGILLNIFQ